MKIGLYFGSFNPIHVGHLIIAQSLFQRGGLDQVWFVVSPQNPLKKQESLAHELDRLRMVELAIEDNFDFRATDVEFRMPRPSYTIDTLTYLEEKYPEYEFSIIMGSDSLENIEKWKSGEVILKRYTICVYERLNYPTRHIEGAKIISIKAPLIEISASLIRSNIKSGKSIRYLVPDSVMNEIERSGYYK